VTKRRTAARRGWAAVAAAAVAVGIGVASGRPGRRRHSELSGFRSPEGMRRYLEAYDEVISQWPVAYKELTIPTPFGNTHVIASGHPEAPPLVLLHATGTSSTGWLLNADALSRRYRVFAVDIIGEAGKSQQTRLLRDRTDCVAWLSTVLDGLGLQRTHLAGWSFGGWTALAYTIDEPDRVEKTVLLAPFGSLAPYAPAVLLFLKLGPYLPMGPPGGLALRMLSPGYRFSPSFARQFVLGGRHFQAADPRISVFPKPFTDEELSSIQTPVLLLVGDHESTFDPQDALAQAQRRIADVRAEIVPGGIGHMIAMEAADLVNERILRFLRD
jgi:pimeloyl-ACP methyl ester carboxylesterase